MRLYDICKMYSASDDLETIIDDAIPYLFESGMTLSCWDNNMVTEDEQLTTAEITALNSKMENMVKHLIIAQNIEMSPTNDLQMWKHLLYGKWMEVKDFYERNFKIQLRVFDPIWFHDYDIYHEGDSKRTDNLTTTIDITESQSGSDENETEALTGNYPNNSNGNLYATAKSETDSTITYDNALDTDGTTKNTGTVVGEDDWHEYRVGAMGRSPNFVQKEAYNNVKNFVAQFAHEFDNYFRWEWEKYFENCACTW